MTHTPGYGNLIALGILDVVQQRNVSPEQIAAAAAYRDLIVRTGRFLTFSAGAATIGYRLREDADQRAALRIIRETGAGLVLSGKVGMHTSPVYAEDVYIGAHSGVDRDGHRATFVVPVNAPGVTVVCRKVSARHANPFLAPLSSRFDELDGQMWLEEVLVPWDRVFLTEPSPDPIAAWCFWHQLYAWLAKAEFTLGLALACAHAMGLKDHEPTIEHLMDLVVDVQTVRSCQTAAELDPDVSTAGYCVPGRGHVAAGSIAMQKARQRMAEILRIVPGSSLVVAPSDKDLTSPEVGAGLEESFGGGQYTALQRAALLQLAADHVSSALDGRESAFELHANGGLVGLARAAPARVHRVQRAGQRRAARPQPRHAGDRSGRPAGHRRCRNDAPSLRPRPVPPGPRSRRDWDRISSRQPHVGHTGPEGRDVAGWARAGERDVAPGRAGPGAGAGGPRRLPRAGPAPGPAPPASDGSPTSARRTRDSRTCGWASRSWATSRARASC